MRRLLSGAAPTGVADSYTVIEDTPLDVYAGVNELVLDGNSYIWSGRDTFADGDGRFWGELSSSGNLADVRFVATDGSPDFQLRFAGPDNLPLAAGTYSDVDRYPFQSPGRPGLSLTGNGRGSNKVGGAFTVLSVARDGNGELGNFHATFEHLNEKDPDAVVRGSLKYHYAAAGTRWGVLKNDADAENDTLTAALVSQAAHGLVVFQDDGSFRYYPQANYNGPDSFTYVTRDGTGESAPTTVNLTVKPVNDAPTFSLATPPAVAEDAGPQRVAQAARDISPGAADEGDQTLQFIVQKNNPGLFSVAPAFDPVTGELTYTPAPNAYGTARLSVYLIDNGGEADGGRDDSNFAQVTINVSPVNDAPVAAEDTYVTPVNVAIDQTAGVPKTAINFTDPNNAFTGNASVTPGSGTITSAMPAGVRGRVLIDYRATASPNQSYSVSFRAPSGEVLRPGTYVNTVGVSGSAPSSPELYVISNSSIYRRNGGQFTIESIRYDAAGNLINFGATFSYLAAGVAFSGSVYYAFTPTAAGVLTNDTDTEGDQLKAVLVAGPAHGTLVLREDGTFKYTPATGFQGIDAFTYFATDGVAQSAPATVRITVGTPPPPVGSISGITFNDLNGNGVRDADETVGAGKTVFLDLDGDNALDTNEARVVTGNNGGWSFAGLSASDYHVRRVFPAGYTASTAPIDVTLTAGQNVVGLTIGSKAVSVPPGNTAALGGFAFDDANKNGVYDATETKTAGKTVFLDADNDGVLDSGEKSVKTAADGSWSFTGLVAGTYHVRRVFPAGYSQSTPPIDPTLVAGQKLTGLAIGSKSGTSTPNTASIAGVAFDDKNKNGKYDAGDVLAAGKTIWLDLDDDGVKDAGEASVVTAANGSFSFKNLAAGKYHVRRLFPSGYLESTPARYITLTSGQAAGGVLIGSKAK